MCDRFDSDDTIAFGHFTLIKSFRLVVKADRKVGRFNKRPGQVFIAILGVALALLFTVAQLFTANATAIRCKIAYFLKSLNIASLQHDRQCQDGANSPNA